MIFITFIMLIIWIAVYTPGTLEKFNGLICFINFGSLLVAVLFCNDKTDLFLLFFGLCLLLLACCIKKFILAAACAVVVLIVDIIKFLALA